MPFGMNAGLGFQRLIDAQMNFVRNGHPVYWRMRNFPDVQNIEAAQLGFAISPSGGQTGTTDILVAPWPTIRMVSQHNIGMSEGKLRLGARYIIISGTFVTALVKQLGLPNQDMVWRSDSGFVGLVTDNLLMDVVTVAHEEWTGYTETWTLTCNAGEIR
jgi:hypothetical protein